ncbi:MAG: hypothetical protein K2L22_02675, partial [Muribaculaceae bacterium]|nr:hypothetical protein [Muribaculaceae bacterium]
MHPERRKGIGQLCGSMPFLPTSDKENEKQERNLARMKPQPIKKTIELGDGRTITIETGKLAKQA